jgi:hypothetical protein
MMVNKKKTKKTSPLKRPHAVTGKAAKGVGGKSGQQTPLPGNDEHIILTPTKKPKGMDYMGVLIDAGRMGALPRMEQGEIDKLTSEDSKKIVELINQLGAFVQSSVESIKSSNSMLSASPTKSAGSFDTIWKNNMKYCSRL